MKLDILLEKDGIVPTRAHDTDVGHDVYSAEDVLLRQFVVEKIKTNICIDVPLNKGFYPQMMERSSMASKGIIILGGVMDPGYKNFWTIIVMKLTPGEYQISKGDKVTQIVYFKYENIDGYNVVSKLEDSERGTSGFGSSGR